MEKVSHSMSGVMSFYRDIFIVRFWSESRGRGDKGREMRGVVEHVRTGKKRYVNHVDQVGEFIGGYVDSEQSVGKFKRALGSRALKRLFRLFSFRRNGSKPHSSVAHSSGAHSDEETGNKARHDGQNTDTLGGKG